MSRILGKYDVGFLHTDWEASVLKWNWNFSPCLGFVILHLTDDKNVLRRGRRQQYFILKSRVKWIRFKVGHKTHAELKVGRSLEDWENDLKQKEILKMCEASNDGKLHLEREFMRSASCIERKWAVCALIP